MEVLVQILIWISSILYIIFVLVITFVDGAVTFNGLEVRNPFLRAVLAALIWPFVGLVLWIIGLIGNLILMPFAALFGLAH